jgi:sugar phosphate permease
MRLYQALILAVAFTLNYFNRWRQQYVLISQECTMKTISLKCNNIQYSTNISSALGYILIGNIYDNLRNPRSVVFWLLTILSALSLIEAVFVAPSNDISDRSVFTLYQMSNVMEAGISVACIVTVHNWFEQKMIGTASAIMLTSLNFQNVTQYAIYNSQPNYDKRVYERTLMIESYFLAAVYALFAVVSWFYFIHHPDEKQVVISDDRLSAADDTPDNLSELRDLIADT